MSKMKLVRDFVQGDSFKIKVEHNPTKDLTGGQLVFTLKKRENSATNVLQITHTVGADILDSRVNGLAYITIPATATANIPAGKYFGSIKRIIGTDVHTIARSDKDTIDLVSVHTNLNT